MFGRFFQMVAALWPYMLMAAVAAYLLGSINFAILVTRKVAKQDIRDLGSGNAGMTNVLRSQGVGPAVFTTLGDVGKSVLAVVLGGLILSFGGKHTDFDLHQLQVVGRYIAGLCCTLGHAYPVFFGFRGGKGVLVTFGMLLVMDWRVALLGLLVFLIVVALSRMVSLGSLTAAVAIVVLTWLFDWLVHGFSAGMVTFCTLVTALIAGLVFYMHRGNIGRIVTHTERKLTFGKKEE